jgi:hypothetical protein
MAGKQVAPEVKGEFGKENERFRRCGNQARKWSWIVLNIPRFNGKIKVMRSEQRLIYFQEQRPAGSKSPAGFFTLPHQGTLLDCRNDHELLTEKFWNRNRNGITAAPLPMTREPAGSAVSVSCLSGAGIVHRTALN